MFTHIHILYTLILYGVYFMCIYYVRAWQTSLVALSPVSKRFSTIYTIYVKVEYIQATTYLTTSTPSSEIFRSTDFAWQFINWSLSGPFFRLLLLLLLLLSWRSRIFKIVWWPVFLAIKCLLRWGQHFSVEIGIYTLALNIRTQFDMPSAYKFPFQMLDSFSDFYDEFFSPVLSSLRSFRFKL